MPSWFDSLVSGFFGAQEDRRNYAGVEDVEYEDLSVNEEIEENIEDWLNGNPNAPKREWSAEKCLRDIQRGAYN